MSALYNALSITFFVVYTLDLSGAMHSLNKAIFKALYGSKIPYNGWQIPLVSCSKCLTFWAVLIQTAIETHNPIRAILTASVMSYLSEMIADTLKLIKELWHNKLDQWTKRD
ncbi:MAG: hypothetical protein SNG04_04510 [Rikenellaceae bacterium]